MTVRLDILNKTNKLCTVHSIFPLVVALQLSQLLYSYVNDNVAFPYRNAVSAIRNSF